MHKLLLSITILIGFVSAALAQPSPVGPPVIACNQNYQVSEGATSLTQIVALKSSTGIYVCGFVINSGAAASTAQLEYGTGTNCGTGTTALTPAFSLPINGSLPIISPYAWGFVPVGDALCLVVTGTGPAQVFVDYGQQ